MNVSSENFESDGDDDRDEPEDPRLAALVKALAKGETVDWQQAESSAGSAKEKEQIRALAAISEVATFHRTWLAEGGILGDLDEDEEIDDEVPTHWGELEILERVGRGSFGDVYKAREPRLDRIVALKLIRASAKTPEREAETLREGRLLAKVRHPNVATVHGAAGADGRVGFWMEFLEGKNLQEILQEKGRFEPREAAEIGIALCRALAAVHAQGIVHRDVKAQNVVRENDGRIVLTDFGVGRDATVIESEEPSLSGTPLYLAPELFEGKPPSPASDLYALGVLLFYLVTGEFPITGESFEELRAGHRERKRRWLKELRKELPGTFVAAVEHALERDPDKRVMGALEMKWELTQFVNERAKVRRLKRVMLAAAVIAVVSSASIWGLHALRAKRREQILAEVAAIEKADPDQAINELKDATKEDPKFVEGWRKLGLLQQTTGDHVGSTEALSKANQLCDGDESVVCLRAKAYYELSCLRYENAWPLFKLVVEREAKDSDSWRQVAMLSGNLLEPRKGVKAARQAGILNPKDPVAVGLLPFMLAQASDATGARKAISTARGHLPDAAYLYWPQGIADLVAGDSERAVEAFSHMEQDSEFSSLGQVLEAQTFLEQGNLYDAAALLEKGLSVDRDSSHREVDQRQILLAEIAFRQSDLFKGRQYLKTLLDEKDGLANIPANLKYFRAALVIAVRGKALDLADRFFERISDLAKASQSRTSRTILAHAEGEITAAQGDPAKAIQLFTDALGIRNDPFLQASRLRLLVGQKDCERAASLARELWKERGLIYADYSIPWVEIRDALDLVKSCTPK